MYYDLNILWPSRVIATASAVGSAATAAAGGAAGLSKRQKAKGKDRNDNTNSNGNDGNAAARAPIKRGVDLLNEQEKAELRKSVEMAIKCMSRAMLISAMALISRPQSAIRQLHSTSYCLLLALTSSRCPISTHVTVQNLCFLTLILATTPQRPLRCSSAVSLSPSMRQALQAAKATDRCLYVNTACTSTGQR